MKDRLVYLAATLESIERILSYTGGYDRSRFLGDQKTQDAVVRNVEMIGQAVRDFGVDALLSKRPTIPWREIAGMRNVLAHEYLGVDPLIVWDTVQTHCRHLTNYWLESNRNHSQRTAGRAGVPPACGQDGCAPRKKADV